MGTLALKGISRCRNLQIVKLIGSVDGFYRAVISDIGLTILAQGALLLVGGATEFDYYMLISLIPFQYILRAYNYYKWLDRRANVETVPRRFLKAILDFVPFIIASLLYGSLWYFFAVVQHITCGGKENRDYGIYKSAKSVLTSRYLPRKILHCSWWGLRNLSSFGSNLETNFDTIQIIFSVVISISGVLKSSRAADIEKEEGKDISSLNKTNTYRSPYLLGFIKENKKGLKAISEHLKPVIYNEDVYIIREGEPLRKMLFIWRGTTLTYTTSKGATNVCKCLEKNDLYGEELVIWALKSASFSELPICTTTLVSLSKVEAYSITANDLKSVVAKFWLFFRRDLSHSPVECFAASSIQIAWRRHHSKKLRDQLAETSGHNVNSGAGINVVGDHQKEINQTKMLKSSLGEA
ncbi:hypothetical protein DVH24_018107 [Malus domestica]|uniref:Cyclic nucleotide-binding domain-containing protein n=1 Tax=Malus domestica TaxID=3750 RepID=A0A498KJX0_MALDO|nr:hypothetical protein DVH24_018107 [Malus domestica]